MNCIGDKQIAAGQFLNWCQRQNLTVKNPDTGLEIQLALSTVLTQPSDAHGPYIQINFPRNGHPGMHVVFADTAARRIPSPREGHLQVMRRLGYQTCIAYGWRDAAVAVCSYLGWSTKGRRITCL